MFTVLPIRLGGSVSDSYIWSVAHSCRVEWLHVYTLYQVAACVHLVLSGCKSPVDWLMCRPGYVYNPRNRISFIPQSLSNSSYTSEAY
jgi:hypothetical protein